MSKPDYCCHDSFSKRTPSDCIIYKLMKEVEELKKKILYDKLDEQFAKLEEINKRITEIEKKEV